MIAFNRGVLPSMGSMTHTNVGRGMLKVGEFSVYVVSHNFPPNLVPFLALHLPNEAECCIHGEIVGCENSETGGNSLF
jgi:hypothetical protein